MSKLNKFLAGVVMVHDVAICNTINKAAKKINDGICGSVLSAMGMAAASVPHVLLAQHLWGSDGDIDHSKKYREHIDRYIERYNKGEYSKYEIADKIVELMYRHPANVFTRAYTYKRLKTEISEVLEQFKNNTMAFRMLIHGPDCFDNPRNEDRDIEQDADILLQLDTDVNAAATLLYNTSYKENLMKLIVALGLAFDSTVSTEALDQFNDGVKRLEDKLAAEVHHVLERDQNNCWSNLLYPFIYDIRDGKWKDRASAFSAYTLVVSNHPEIAQLGLLDEFEYKVSLQLDSTFPEDHPTASSEVKNEEDNEAFFQQFVEDLYSLRFNRKSDAWGFYESLRDNLFKGEDFSSFDQRAEDLIDEIFIEDANDEGQRAEIDRNKILAHFTAKVNGGAFGTKLGAIRAAGKLTDLLMMFRSNSGYDEFADKLKEIIDSKEW